MPPVKPRVILRLGSHAEKEYVDKTARRLDGLIIGANLMEAAPGATASLIVRFGGKGLNKPVYLDPMTYAFGRYFDPELGKRRDDLDWIKSDQKVKGTKQVGRKFKRSYRQLAERLGGLFEQAITRRAAIGPPDFQDQKTIRQVATAVTEYQLARVREEFEKDPDFALANEIPEPPAVFAPYFYIEPSEAEAWTTINLQLAGVAAAVNAKPVHALICADESFLLRKEFLSRLRAELPETGVTGVWLWFSKFREEGATLAQLRAFRSLVEDLSDGLSVFHLHGGYFSLALSRVGLEGVSHGVGYGEQKDVIPIIGQSTPTVRYYVPPMRKRLGVVQIERSFSGLGINSAADFYEQICDCVVCKGVIGDDLRKFAEFGDMHYSMATSKRLAQTPAAAKRCRFHFLLRRFLERDAVADANLQAIRADMKAAHGRWSTLPAIGAVDRDHLDRWHEVLA